MSDNYSGWIKIGGKITPDLTRSLIDAIHEDGPGLDWGEYGVKIENDKELLNIANQVNAMGEEDKSLFLCDDQAREGAFPSIETFCENHDIQFTRCSESFGEYDAERAEYRPGMSCAEVNITDQVGNYTMSATNVQELVEALCCKNIKKEEETLAILKKVKSDLPTIFPDLEPFEIVEG